MAAGVQSRARRVNCWRWPSGQCRPAGHVTSIHSGNVFENLDRARAGDLVNVFAEQQVFEYRVVSIAHLALGYVGAG
jgi:hypothetical protein